MLLIFLEWLYTKNSNDWRAELEFSQIFPRFLLVSKRVPADRLAKNAFLSVKALIRKPLVLNELISSPVTLFTSNA